MTAPLVVRLFHVECTLLYYLGEGVGHFYLAPKNSRNRVKEIIIHLRCLSCFIIKLKLVPR